MADGGGGGGCDEGVDGWVEFWRDLRTRPNSSMWSWNRFSSADEASPFATILIKSFKSASVAAFSASIWMTGSGCLAGGLVVPLV